MNNKSYSEGKSNPNFIIKNILISNFILIILFMFILSSISVFAATNVSILYAWNGTSNVPIQVDAAGRLKTTLNLSKSTGITPEIDNLYDLGGTSLRWKSLYVFDIIAAGSVSISGSLNASSINVTGNLQTSTLNVTNVNENATFEGDVLIKGKLYGGSPLRVRGGINVTVATADDAFFLTDSSNNIIFRITDKGELNISSSAGNTSFDDGTLFIDATNNRTGIGTTTPATTLDVQGNANVSGTLSVGSFQLGSTSASTMNITGEAITFTGENGSLYQPVYGTDDDLVLYLPFSIDQTNISNTTYDRSPYGNDGTLTNMNQGDQILEGNVTGWTPGKYGNAMGFDGKDDFINISDADVFDFEGNDFSISLWFKADGAQRSLAGLVNKGIGQDENNGWTAGYTNTNTLRFIARNGGSTIVDFTGGSVSENTWTFYTATRSGSTFTLYQDVTQIATASSGTAIDATDGDVFIGRLRADSSFFNGSIDEVMIYRRALSIDEIRTHYLRGSGFGASGAITADKFRIVNTSGSKQLEINQSHFSITNTSGDQLFVVDKVNNQILLPLDSDAVTPTLAFGDGDSGFYENTDDKIRVATGGVTNWEWNGGIFSGVTGGSVSILNEVASATNPTLIPDKGDDDTGIGQAAADQLSLIAGGVEGMRIEKSTATVQSNFSVNDTDGTSRLFLDVSTGNVGIGTTTPNFKLDVDGQINATNISLAGAVGTNVPTLKFGDGDTGFYEETDDDLRVLIGGTAAFIITNNKAGVLGGTNRPTMANEEPTSTNPVFAPSGNNLGTGIGWATTDQLSLIAGDIEGIRIEKSTVTVKANFTVNDTDGTNRFFIDVSNGKVGIGTTTPATTLDVQGDANVSGTLSVGSFQLGSTSASTMNITGAAITFTSENGSLYQPVYGTDDGLVLYLPFNAPNGTTQFDRSPFGNDGTLTGAINCNVSVGRYGTACEFNGNDSYVLTSNIINFSVTNRITYEAWFKIKGLGSSDGDENDIIVIKNVHSYHQLVYQPANNRFKCQFSFINPNSETSAQSSNGVLKNGTWHYAACVYDGANVIAYLDGVQVASTAVTKILHPATQAATIGALRNVADIVRLFNGTIDEVRIYTRALTVEEIRTHYLRGSGFGASGAITADKFRIVNTSGNVNLIVDNTGNVGIGTTTPLSKLHINESTDSSKNTVLTLNGNLRGTPTDADEAYINFTLTDSDGNQNEFVRMTWIADDVTANSKDGSLLISGRSSSQAGTLRSWLRLGGNNAQVQAQPGAGPTIPSYTWIGDLNTGMQSPATDEISFATDGKERLRIDSSGNVGINTTTPAQTLTVQGTLNVTADGTAGPNLFVASDGNVGIGTVNPSQKLEVTGYINVTGTDTSNSTFNGDVRIIGTLYGSSPLKIGGGLNITSGNILFPDGTVQTSAAESSGSGNSTAWNRSGTNVILSSLTDNVGIGTTTPLQTLVVVGTVNITDSLNVTNNIETGGFFIGDGSLLTGITTGSTGPFNSSGTNVFLNNSGSSVGIGTINPSAKLHVNGSVIVEGNLSVSSLEILSNFSYKIMGGCYEDTSIDITDDTTFCDASLPSNVTSVYFNGTWRVKCCVPQGMCFKDTDVTLTDSSTVCNKDINYSVTSIFFNADSKWQAKCCNNAGSCFDDEFITITDTSTICDAESNADIVTVGYNNAWEVTCCEGSIR